MFKKFAVIALVTASIGVAHAHGDYQQPQVGFYVTPYAVSVTYGNPYFQTARPYYDDRYREYRHHHDEHRGYGYYERQHRERW
jgi:hypothetical protein